MALNVVSEKPAEPETQFNPQIMMALNFLATAVKTFSNRAIIAIYNTFSVGMFGVAAYLWYSVLQNITYQQIAGCTIFSLFTLGMVKLVRRV